MSLFKRKRKWQLAGASVTGSAHQRRKHPNQDALILLPESEKGSSVLIAAADGHGGRSYFRSVTGAELAVECAADFFSKLVKRPPDVPFIMRYADENLAKDIVKMWREKTGEHFENNPFTEEENKRAAGHPERDAPYIFYGTTLRFAAIMPLYSVFFRIGDGETVVKYEENSPESVFNEDKLPGDETVSLCSPNVVNAASVRIIQNKNPDLILICTDGYVNSFTDKAGFLQSATDLQKLIKEDGIDSVRENLTEWLRETSKKGSGDDTTLVVASAD